MNLNKILRSAMVTAAFTLIAFTTATAQGKQTTLTGKVSDVACGAEHKMKNMSAGTICRAHVLHLVPRKLAGPSSSETRFIS